MVFFLIVDDTNSPRGSPVGLEGWGLGCSQVLSIYEHEVYVNLRGPFPQDDVVGRFFLM